MSGFREVCTSCRRITCEVGEHPLEVRPVICASCRVGRTDYSHLWLELVAHILPTTAERDDSTAHAKLQAEALCRIEEDRALLRSAHERLKTDDKLTAGVYSLADRDPVLRATLASIRRRRQG